MTTEEQEMCKESRYRGVSREYRKEVLLNFRNSMEKKQSEIQSEIATGTISNIGREYEEMGIIEINVDRKSRANIWRLKIGIPLLEEILCLFIYPEEDLEKFRELLGSSTGEEIVNFVFNCLNLHTNQEIVWDFLLEYINKYPHKLKNKFKENLRELHDLEHKKIDAKETLPQSEILKLDEAMSKIESGDDGGWDDFSNVYMNVLLKDANSVVETVNETGFPAKRFLDVIRFSPKAFELVLKIAKCQDLDDLITEGFILRAKEGIDLLAIPKKYFPDVSTEDDKEPEPKFGLALLSQTKGVIYAVCGTGTKSIDGEFEDIIGELDIFEEIGVEEVFSSLLKYLMVYSSIVSTATRDCDDLYKRAVSLESDVFVSILGFWLDALGIVPCFSITMN